MPPHNAFAHVVDEDMDVLDRLIEHGPLKVQNWGSINATGEHAPLSVNPDRPGLITRSSFLLQVGVSLAPRVAAEGGQESHQIPFIACLCALCRSLRARGAAPLGQAMKVAWSS